MGERELQYWNKTRTKVLRVQQSMSSCSYRVVSIRPEQAESCWVGGAMIPSWATDFREEAGALAQLRAYAEKNQLEVYTKGEKSNG